MRRLFINLFALCVGLFLGGYTVYSHAATTYYWSAFINGAQSVTYTASDPTSACVKAVAGYYGSGFTTTFTATSSTNGWCTMKRTSDNFNFGNVGQVSRMGDSCPTGQVYDATTYTCVTAAKPLPVDPNCPTGMRVFVWAVPETPNLPAMPVCMADGDPSTTIPAGIPDSQCSYKNPSTGKCEAACPNGSYWGQVPTGAMDCIKSIDNTVNTDNLPHDCPAGYMNLSATDQPNCTKPSTTPQGLPKPPPGTEKPTVAPTPATAKTVTLAPTTTTGTDGSSTTKQDTQTTNRDGSVTTTTTTTVTDAGGNKTLSVTSTTGKTPSGFDGVSDSQTNDQTDLCIRHPELNICKNGAVTQADCAATICTGDAIACATLRQQIQAQCQAQKDSDAIKGSGEWTLGDKILAGLDPLSGSLPGDKPQTVNMSQLDQSGFLGGGQCFEDRTITVMTRDIVLPFSKACEYLITFRYVIMIIASLICFRLVGGTVLRD